MSVSAARKLELFAEFQSLVEAKGGTVLEQKYLGSAVKHHVLCAAGHECHTRPSDVKRGDGFCRECYLANRPADPRSVLAWAAFKTAVENQGGVVLEMEWLGDGTGHYALCSEGHDCWPIPASVKQNQGICGPCGIVKRTTTVKARTWARFKAHVEALGGTVLVPETEWLGIAAKYRVLCDQGHECYRIPNNVEQYDSLSCEICSGRDAATQWAAFRNAVEAQGGIVLEAEWRGSTTKHRIRCGEGHDRRVMPSPIAHGRQGICRMCGLTNGLVAATKAKSAPAWAEFKSAVEAAGSIVLEAEWLGSGKLHRVRCAEGHVTELRPNDVQRGITSFCTTWPCYERDPIAVKKAFYAAIEDSGGKVVGEYANSKTRVRVRCGAGHDWDASPDSTGQGHGCPECARNSLTIAKSTFYAAIGAQDGKVLGEYVNSKTPVLVRCVDGHERLRNPGHVIRENAGCLACSGLDPVIAEANFRAALAEVGATPLYERWMGSIQPHKMRCSDGHITSPSPNNIQQGGRICGQCAGMIFDVVYEVSGPRGVKFGKSSNAGTLRLRTHRYAGYPDVIRLWIGLPDGVATAVENMLKYQVMPASPFEPIQGTEYYEQEAEPLILEVLDRELAWYTPVVGPGQARGCATHI